MDVDTPPHPWVTNGIVAVGKKSLLQERMCFKYLGLKGNDSLLT